ncbi:MAG TPA: RDD family protein [Terriglobales bacterium]|nr:RDD family protein [Terriglobales bacterium]
MKSRFEPEPDPAINPDGSLDPEAYDASQEQFAARGDQEPRVARGHFVVDAEDASGSGQLAGSARPRTRATGADPNPVVEAVAALGNGAAEAALPVAAAEIPAQSDRQSWRLEVQARITLYRRRKRPPPPRYPSLALKSESSRSRLASGSTVETRASSGPANAQAVETGSTPSTTGGRGKLLQFFRSSIAPPQAMEELAEPVVESPPILEVPDVMPPPPALGGILIEPSEHATPKGRPGLELPLRTAPMVRRIVALLVDGLFVVASVGLFTYISSKMGLEGLARKEILSLATILTALLWAGYQYLLLVYVGTTPGLRLAKLHLRRFDSRPVSRGLRRWRVLASLLSGLSLTLGYAWCFLDEDQLCWHDRITQTYMAPLDRK